MAKGLFGLKEKLADADLARRTRTADLLDKVAGCIENIAENFQNFDAMIPKCEELQEYRRSLIDVIGPQVGDIDRKRIEQWLESSVHARGMMLAAKDAWHA